MLENLPFLGDFPSYTPLFASRIFQPATFDDTGGGYRSRPMIKSHYFVVKPLNFLLANTDFLFFSQLKFENQAWLFEKSTMYS